MKKLKMGATLKIVVAVLTGIYFTHKNMRVYAIPTMHNLFRIVRNVYYRWVLLEIVMSADKFIEWITDRLMSTRRKERIAMS